MLKNINKKISIVHKSTCLFLCIALIGITTISISQTGSLGVNTSDPKTTLHVVKETSPLSKPEGIIAPRVTLAELNNAASLNLYNQEHDDAIVYVYESTGTPSGETENILAKGYYYWESLTSRWIPFVSRVPQYFYMPSILLPIDGADNTLYNTYNNATNTFTVNLYDRYAAQFEFNSPPPNSTKNLSANLPLPIYLPNQLEFFVTYYDSSVFTNVSVNDAGVLTYTVASNPPISDKTFMNIIFMVK
jgi:hypothetical protein